MGLESAIPTDAILTTQLRVVNWAAGAACGRSPFATACCGIELMATASSRYDIARFGMERMSFSPPERPDHRGRGIGIKMLPVLQRIYQQVTEPKWVISMGACQHGRRLRHLRDRAGHRPVHPRRRLHPRLPPTPGDAP